MNQKKFHYLLVYSNLIILMNAIFMLLGKKSSQQFSPAPLYKGINLYFFRFITNFTNLYKSLLSIWFLSTFLMASKKQMSFCFMITVSSAAFFASRKIKCAISPITSSGICTGLIIIANFVFLQDTLKNCLDKFLQVFWQHFGNWFDVLGLRENY